VLPALIRGDSVIVKPLLRGPLSPVAFALQATGAGLPAGVVNIVQGTGGDIGADLTGRRELSALFVRGGERTIAQAERAHARTNVPLHVLRGGGNVLIVGPDLDLDAGPDLDTIADAVKASVRIHSAGGPFGLPLLAVHADQAERILPAVLDRWVGTVAAPLPTEPLRRRAVQRMESLIEQGATVAMGGPSVPDDIAHRMSWRLPPTVLLLGDPYSPAARREQAIVPLGPVLSVVSWTHGDQLEALSTAPSARDGVAKLWGRDDSLAARLPHGRVATGNDAPRSLFAKTGPATWTDVGR
jgi:acyl-CoA reductase-like NAD-dependent aldehyde dehydrogenase